MEKNVFLLFSADSNSVNQIVRSKREASKKIPSFAHPKKMSQLIIRPAESIAIFSCKSLGNPIPNITWYKNDQQPNRSVREIRYHHWKMVLEDLTLEDTANYTCVVCNELGCINFTYTLHVLGKFFNIMLCIIYYSVGEKDLDLYAVRQF